MTGDTLCRDNICYWGTNPNSNEVERRDLQIHFIHIFSWIHYKASSIFSKYFLQIFTYSEFNAYNIFQKMPGDGQQKDWESWGMIKNTCLEHFTGEQIYGNRWVSWLGIIRSSCKDYSFFGKDVVRFITLWVTEWANTDRLGMFLNGQSQGI